MSSSRGNGSEESILARLEQNSGRGLSADLSPVTKALLYGTAGVLVVLLIVTLAWLARDNGRQDEALLAAQAIQVAPEAAMTGSAPAEELAAEEHPPMHGAVITETPQAPAAEAPAGQPAPPPLVLLPSDETAAVADTREAPVPPPVKETAAVEEAAPVPEAVQAEPEKAPTLRVEAVRSKPAAKPAPKAVRTAAVTKPLQRNAAAKVKKAAPAEAPAEAAPVDTDVALISAIIAHSNKHAAERDAAADCAGDKKCGAKPATQH